jgi:hypothetical protein
VKRATRKEASPSAGPPAADPERRCTAFDGGRRLASGALADVARAVARALAAGAAGPLLVFDDATGHVIDLDTRGSEDDVAARYATRAAPRAAARAAPRPEAPEPRGPGRPKLGVVAREVTLLPRHWDWLAAQPGGASAALRRLVEEARARGAPADRARRGREVAYRVMHALAGDRPGFEAAARALFAGDRAGVRAAAARWPSDVRGHVDALAFGGDDPAA